MNVAVRKSLLCLITVLLSLSVCACGQSTGTDADGMEYMEKQVDVCRSTATSANTRDGKITLRFYSDQPNVPYVSIKEYYAAVMKGCKSCESPQMLVTKQSDSDYLMRSNTGEALIDVKADVLMTDDITRFVDQMSLVDENIAVDIYDGSPFVEPAGTEYERKEVSYDMGSYDIDVRGEEDDVFFPVATISDLTSDPYGHHSAYNGDKFYFYESGADPFFSSGDDNYYKTRLENAANGGRRQKDLVEFSYNELCFNIDHSYGEPGREFIHEELQQGDLASALQDLGEPGKKIIELLKSDSYAEYFNGISRLQDLLSDGGHTSLGSIANNAMYDDALMDAYLEVQNKTADIFDATNANAVSRETDENMVIARQSLRESILHCGEETYVKQGDTALCILDGFENGIEDLWDDYYKGKTERPAIEKLAKDREPDAVLIVRDAIDRASADPEVKNLILDISNNSGGHSDQMLAVYAMLSGSGSVSMKSENVYAGIVREDTYRVDCNLDKVFDSKDDIRSDLNIGILTSRSSYSCGNMLPLLMKEAGYIILGEQSGGGPCCVGVFATPEGFEYSMSSGRARLTDKDGIPHDEGVRADVNLLREDRKGKVKTIEMTVPEFEDHPEAGNITVSMPDYAEFYNLARLSEEMEKIK